MTERELHEQLYHDLQTIFGDNVMVKWPEEKFQVPLCVFLPIFGRKEGERVEVRYEIDVFDFLFKDILKWKDEIMSILEEYECSSDDIKWDITKDGEVWRLRIDLYFHILSN